MKPTKRPNLPLCMFVSLLLPGLYVAVVTFQPEVIPLKLAMSIAAAKAEETLIASLLKNPDFYYKIKDKLSVNDFSTSLNGRLYSLIAARLDEQRPVEATYFAGELTDEELGYFVRLESMRENLGNTVQECLDCIKRMKDEKKDRETKRAADMTDDEWAAMFKKPER